MKIKRTCLCIIFSLMCLMVLVGCQSESAAPQNSPVAVSAAPAEPAAVEPSEDGAYHVSSADELLLALGNGRSIVLEEGEYDLSLAEGYGKLSGDCWYWRESYDGYELVISGAEDMSISGSASIVTRPRYSNVLCLENCKNIALNGLTLGHTVEKGSCTGGVVYIENSQDLRLDSCNLYGCGIVGINAFNSRDILLSACQIYDCSYSAVQLGACSNVQLVDCGIHNNGENFFGALFQADNCRGFALVNCDIYENSATALIRGSYSQQISILGCTVKDNMLSDTVIDCVGYSPVFDKCGFDSNGGTELYSAMPPTDLEGNLLELADVLNMRQEDAEYSGPVDAEPVELNESINAEGIRQVRVSTVDEFLAAIGSDTAIKLEPGLYDLSQATDFGAYGTKYYYWIDTYDGPALVISGVQNLSIDSEDGVSITALPRYANVLSFANCENISLTGFTAGHSVEPGACVGGVLRFENCWGVDILDCRLFGCGTWGINAYYCSDMNVTATEIYDCTIGAIGLYTVMGAEFERMNIHDCATPEFSLADCMDVNYEGQELKAGDYILMGGVPTEYRY